MSSWESRVVARVSRKGARVAEEFRNGLGEARPRDRRYSSATHFSPFRCAAPPGCCAKCGALGAGTRSSRLCYLYLTQRREGRKGIWEQLWEGEDARQALSLPLRGPSGMLREVRCTWCMNEVQLFLLRVSHAKARRPQWNPETDWGRRGGETAGQRRGLVVLVQVEDGRYLVPPHG